MKKALDKILNNFAFTENDIIKYNIDEYNTPEEDQKKYETNVWVSNKIGEDDVWKLTEKITTSLTMLGFNSIYSRVYNNTDKDEYIVIVSGNIKNKE